MYNSGNSRSLGGSVVLVSAKKFVLQPNALRGRIVFVTLCCLVLMFSLVGLVFSSPEQTGQSEIFILGSQMQTYDLDGVQWRIPLQIISFGTGTGTARLVEFRIDANDLLKLVPEPQRTMPVIPLDNEIDRESFRKWIGYRQRAAILMVRNDERISFSAEEEREFRELQMRFVDVSKRRRDISPVELIINVPDLPFKVARDGHYKVRMVVESGQLRADWEGEIIILDVEPLVTSPVFTSPSPHTVGVLVNGSPVLFDVEPYINSNNRLMAPLRAVAEALGASVYWDGAGRTVAVELQGRKVLFSEGRSKVIADGEQKMMDTVPVVRDGRTFVPVRFLGEKLGVQVTWDNLARTATLDSFLPVSQ